MGDMALETMLWRTEHPEAPPKTIAANAELIIRDSCGFPD
jgi:DNA-binding LacI/PurR family transcriptional regulator